MHHFIGTKLSPDHLSVGAVLLDARRKVYCHRARNVQKKTDLYFLMRETVRPGESLEKALARGLSEEFGIRAKLVRYLGSLVSEFTNWERARIRKTTLYFLCAPFGAPRKKMMKEVHYGVASSPEWRSIPFLIRHMRRQSKVLRRTDFDESEILRRV